MNQIRIDGQSLSLEAVAQVARGHPTVALAAEALPAIIRAAEMVQRIVAEGRRIYGINTGFGALSTETIPLDSLAELQANLLRSHAAGVGPA